MAFSRPTLQQIIDRIHADFVAKITGAATLALRSVLLIIGRALAGAVHLLYGYIDNSVKEMFVVTATADTDGGKLDTLGSEYGILRKAATPAVGIVTIIGTATTVVPAGSALSSSAGNRYVTDAEAIIGGGGSITAAITCDTAGSAGNDNAGVSLSFESPIVDVDSTATVDADGLYDGTDIEIDAAYRTRILARKRQTPHGGAAFDLEAWALEVAAVTRAWAYPLYNGAGTVALYFVCDAQTPITPTAAQLAAVLAHLTEHTNSLGQTEGVPVTMLPGLSVLAPTVVVKNYTIKLYPNTTAVQVQVTAQITDFLLREGYPANTMYLSNFGEAISAAADEQRSSVVGGADNTLAYNQVAILGTITYQGY